MKKLGEKFIGYFMTKKIGILEIIFGYVLFITLVVIPWIYGITRLGLKIMNIE